MKLRQIMLIVPRVLSPIVGVILVMLPKKNCCLWSYHTTYKKLCGPGDENRVYHANNARTHVSYRVVYKSRQPAKFAGFSARFHWLLSLLHESRYVEEMMFIRSHNCLLFTKLRLLKTLVLHVGFYHKAWL